MRMVALRSPVLVGHQRRGGGTAFNDRHMFLRGRTARHGLASALFGACYCSQCQDRFGPWEALCDQHFPQPFEGEDRKPPGQPRLGPARVGADSFVKGLILAQNERWRRGLGMQVERVRRKAGQWRKGE